MQSKMRMVEMGRVVALSAVMTALLAIGAMAFVARPARAAFGVAAVDQQITSSAAGGVFSQAGGHPYEISTEIDFNSHIDPDFGSSMPDADVKDLRTNLPPGLLGNPVGIPQCTAGQLIGVNQPSQGIHVAECPVASEVGTVELKVVYFGEDTVLVEPVYNMAPAANVPAAFGFDVAGQAVVLAASVRSDSDFGITLLAGSIPNAFPVHGLKLTFWGVPADPAHDIQRCSKVGGLEPVAPYGCEGTPGTIEGPQSDPEPPRAFLTLPGACTAPGAGLKTNFQFDSWAEPGVFLERDLFSHAPPGYPLSPEGWGAQVGVTGCDVVPFDPGFSVQSTSHEAGAPTGVNIDLSFPQEGLGNPTGLATANLRKAVVTLPAGMSVSPSAANGLGACSQAQIGLGATGTPACPDSSKLGTVEVDTPLLPDPLEGSIYLAAQGDNPFGSLLALYIVAEGHGVVLKLPGQISADPQTGQLTTTFDNNPQLPFSDLKLSFKGGSRAPLVNPPVCGTDTVTTELTPWSAGAPARPSSSFEVSSGSGGGPCPSPAPFAPSFTAGTVNNQAGAFSPFTLTFSRSDADQALGGLTVQTPPGLLGVLKSVPLCGEPQASQGTCGPESLIGHTTVGAGAGANPFYLGGKVFLTGPYKGAPFGLSIAVPAVAGPFNLGLVVVRASIAVDPLTAQLKITSDPLPTILQGIPLDLRTVNVTVDRAGFMFNPTDCEALSVNGTLTSTQGASAAVSGRFQAANCASLGFAPKFTASSLAKTSRQKGAALDVKIAYPSGPQANIRSVVVTLPKQLPARLSTIQQACPEATFDANPASCSEGGLVGMGTAVTPILSAPLTGPAYLVSHGGAAFPDIVVVLQGQGITLDLVGNVNISKAGITSATFAHVPDAPISSFELSLPEGPHSGLSAVGNLCTTSLAMPTTITGQNGAVIEQSTKIRVGGCPKAKKKHKAKRRHRKKAKKGNVGAQKRK